MKVFSDEDVDAGVQGRGEDEEEDVPPPPPRHKGKPKPKPKKVCLFYARLQHIIDRCLQTPQRVRNLRQEVRCLYTVVARHHLQKVLELISTYCMLSQL